MEKKGYFVSGLVLIVFSLVLIYCYLTTATEFAIAVISMIIGVIGVMLLCRSGKINEETFILSTLLLMFGGFLVPLLSPQTPTLMIAIAYGGAIFLLMFNTPEETSKKTSVQQ